MVVVAPIQAHDVHAVVTLFEEMDHFYGDVTVGTRDEHATQIADALFGALLMDALFETARRHHCSRVEWTTDDANKNARRFYDELTAAMGIPKVFYRVELDATAT